MPAARSIVIGLLATALLALAASPAAAQMGSSSFQSQMSSNEFMLTGHFRAIHIPDFALGLFYDEHGSTWDGDKQNFSYGGQFTWRRGSDFELGVGFDFADYSTPDAFWLDSGDDPQEDARWVESDLQAWSVIITAYWFWDVSSWLSPYVGGGIGPGFIVDNSQRYRPREGTACAEGLGQGQDFAPAACFDDQGNPDPGQIDLDNPTTDSSAPPALPMVTLTSGVRFNLFNRGVLRLEAGIQPHLFAGAGVGVQW